MHALIIVLDKPWVKPVTRDHPFRHRGWSVKTGGLWTRVKYIRKTRLMHPSFDLRWSMVSELRGSLMTGFTVFLISYVPLQFNFSNLRAPERKSLHIFNDNYWKLIKFRLGSWWTKYFTRHCISIPYDAETLVFIQKDLTSFQQCSITIFKTIYPAVPLACDGTVKSSRLTNSSDLGNNVFCYHTRVLCPSCNTNG